METLDPASPSAELLVRDDPTGPVQVAPPVVAVVVTNDPGPWLESTLRSLGAQDYEALSVLVLDNGSTDDPTSRIADVLPRAFVRRRAADSAGFGFAEAANEAVGAVEGAMFLLFCHDDVTLAPDAVRLLVEEAYRSNAAIVGPKLVDHDQPDILLEVGMAVDHYGVPYSGIEPDEVDQEQHDAVRDVFFVSHAAMLVRTDLLQELGGFDPATFPGADDIDLCWRARLAGARVVVAPSARVRHRRATVADARATRRSEPRVLYAQTRSRARLLCKSYSFLRLLWVLPVAFVLVLGEAIGLLFSGRPRHAGALVMGWISAFGHPGELRRARAETQHLRRVDDSDVRDLMIHGSARMRAFVNRRMHASARMESVGSRTRLRVNTATESLRRAPAMLAVALGVLLVFGARSLLFSRVPEVGAFRAWPGAGSAWATFTGGWRETFMGAGVAAAPAFALMAGINTVLLGHAGLAQSLVVGGALPVGAWGAYRLVRPFSTSALPGVSAAIAYGANPLPRNAIYHGALGPLVCFALAPFVCKMIVDASERRGVPTRRLHTIAGLALLIAISTAVWPPALFIALLIAGSMLIAVPFTRDGATSGRAIVVAVGATGLAAVLCVPWAASLLGADPATLGFVPRAPLSLAATLAFHTGRAGAGIAPFGILAAGAVPLAIAHGPRLAWATRAWVLTVLSFALAWLPGRIAPSAALPSPDGVLIGAALGLAFAAGLGVAAIVDDLRQWHFGWRQVLTVVATAGLAVAMLGLAADTISGRFGLGNSDWPARFSWMNGSVPAGNFRVLWVGDPTILPADAKTVGDTGFALTRDGTGDARVLWPAPEQHADRVLASAIATAEAGDTSRLGHLLAPAGVRYIAFVTRAAPDSGEQGRPQQRLADALARQLDLTVSRVEPSGTVYEDDAWLPMHALVPPTGANVRPDAADPVAGALRSEPDGVKAVAVSHGRTARTGPGTLLWSEASDGGWHATVNGHTVPRSTAFGWTNAFALDTNARVSVHYSTSAMTVLLRLLQVAAWFAVAAVWIATRRRRNAAKS